MLEPEKKIDPTEFTEAEVMELDDLFDDILDHLFQEAEEAIQNKTGYAGTKHIKYRDQLKIDLAKKAWEISKKFNAQARFSKLVDNSNTVVPCLTKVFGEKAVIKALPKKAVNENVADMCDKAGADELANLIRKAVEPTGASTNKPPSM